MPPAFVGADLPRPFPPSAPGIRAFTLVEMLAAVAVIGIVATLLLPGLQRARQQALFTGCASNLRQAGMALNLYANDNNNSFPSEYSSTLGVWSKVLINQNYLQQPSVLACPADHYRSAEIRPRSYVYCSPSMTSMTPVNRLQIPQPTKTYMLTEWHLQTQDYLGYGASVAGADVITVSTVSHPGGTRNMLFIDGHVERRTVAQASPTTSGWNATAIVGQ